MKDKRKIRFCIGPGFLSDINPRPCPRGKVQCGGRRLRCDDCMLDHKAEYQKERGRKINEDLKASFFRGQRNSLPGLARNYQALVMPNFSAMRCRGCGCTERRACPPTCWWVGKELCSSCATPEQLYIHKVAEDLGQLVRLFNGMFELPKELRLKVKGKEDTQERLQYKEETRRLQGKPLKIVGKKKRGRPRKQPAWSGKD